MKLRQINSRIGVAVLALAALFGATTSGYGQTPASGTQIEIPQIDQDEAKIAYKAFSSEGNPDTKIQLGEEFDLKYPTSHYQTAVNSVLVSLYYGKGNWAKFYD